MLNNYDHAHTHNATYPYMKIPRELNWMLDMCLVLLYLDQCHWNIGFTIYWGSQQQTTLIYSIKFNDWTEFSGARNGCDWTNWKLLYEYTNVHKKLYHIELKCLKHQSLHSRYSHLKIVQCLKLKMVMISLWFSHSLKLKRTTREISFILEIVYNMFTNLLNNNRTSKMREHFWSYIHKETFVEHILIL